MKAIIFLCLLATALAMPYGPVIEPAWGGHGFAAPVAYAQPVVKHFAPVAYAQPVVKQFVQAAPVVKAVAPAASSYATFSQVHTSHPQPIVKHVVAQPVIAQPVVKHVVAQPVYQPFVQKVVAQPVYAQPLVQKVVAQPVYAHNPW